MDYDLTEAAAKLSLPPEKLRDHILQFHRLFLRDFEEIRINVKSSDYEKIYFEFHKLKSTFNLLSINEGLKLCSLCCEHSHKREEFDYLTALGQLSSVLNDLVKAL